MNNSRKECRTVTPVLPFPGAERDPVAATIRACGLQLEPVVDSLQVENDNVLHNNGLLSQISAQLAAQIGLGPAGLCTPELVDEALETSAQISADGAELRLLGSCIQEHFASASWGWMDDRTAVLFPFWLNTLRALSCRDIRPLVVISAPWSGATALASREEIAALAVKLGEPALRAAELVWGAHAGVLLSIAEETGCLVTVDQWLSDPNLDAGEFTRCAH